MHLTKKREGRETDPQKLFGGQRTGQQSKMLREAAPSLHRQDWGCWSSSWALPRQPCPALSHRGPGVHSCSLHLPRSWVTGFMEGIGLLEGGDRMMFSPLLCHRQVSGSGYIASLALPPSSTPTVVPASTNRPQPFGFGTTSLFCPSA